MDDFLELRLGAVARLKRSQHMNVANGNRYAQPLTCKEDSLQTISEGRKHRDVVLDSSKT